jgi:glycosyltransferase involved in cell wall biosynthesis
MRRSVAKSSRILANSLYTARLLRKEGYPAERISVLSGGVDSERFGKKTSSNGRLRKALNLPQDAFILMTACRMAPKKGLDFLLSSFKLLLKKIPDAHLVVVGEGKERGKCDRLCRTLQLDGRVTFPGRVPHENIHEYFWASDLFVLASRECRNRVSGMKDVETMGRVLCEANAAGVPVVASRTGGIPSVVAHGENGLLFASDDRADFFRQVMRIRNDAGLVKNLIQNGLSRAEKEFDWSVIVKRHEDAFSGLYLRIGQRIGP